MFPCFPIEHASNVLFAFWPAAPKGRCPVGYRGELPYVHPSVIPHIPLWGLSGPNMERDFYLSFLSLQLLICDDCECGYHNTTSTACNHSFNLTPVSLISPFSCCFATIAIVVTTCTACNLRFLSLLKAIGPAICASKNFTAENWNHRLPLRNLSDLFPVFLFLCHPLAAILEFICYKNKSTWYEIVFTPLSVVLLFQNKAKSHL